MGKWYTKEEDSLIKLFLKEGCAQKEIGELIGRSRSSIEHRIAILKLNGKKIKLKTHEQYKKDLAEKCPTMIVLEEYKGAMIKILHKCLICSKEYKTKPNDKLNGSACKFCAGKGLKTNDQYVSELKEKCSSMKVLETYISNRVPILHRCNKCKAEYKVMPESKLKGYACKVCSPLYGIRHEEPGILYLVYFYDIDLYKYGITNYTTEKRLKYIGYEYNLIFERNYIFGIDALYQEHQWSKNVQHLKVNTGLLKSGNTETFRYK